MPQMLRLSQGHWLNLEQLVAVQDHGHQLVVTLTPAGYDQEEGLIMGERVLKGEERERLLAWLATHSAYVSTPRADNDDENPPF
jgi:hypothetical protein